MDRERFIFRFGHWSGSALSQPTGVPGASEEMQGMRQMPSIASVKGHRSALPCSLCFRRTHILVLLASLWGPSMAPQAPLHPCEWAPSWATGNGPTGGLFRHRGWFSLAHIGVQCCSSALECLKCPQLTLRHSPGPREWPYISGPAAKPERMPRDPCTVLDAHIWAAELSLAMSWRVWQAPADFTEELKHQTLIWAMKFRCQN